MKVALNRCGIAITYDIPTKDQDKKIQFNEPREQGSLIGYQKRQIANAIEVMRADWKKIHGCRPLVFVLTTPGYLDIGERPNFLKKWIDTMRKNHGLTHYVWVKERTKKGFLHWHFVATVKRFDFVKASQLWSSYFGSNSKCSLRAGMYRGKKRVGLYIRSPRHAWYLSKYFGKGLGKDDLQIHGLHVLARTRSRTFGISEDLAKLSAPIILESDWKSDIIQKQIFTTKGWQLMDWPVNKRRVWADSDGVLIEDKELKKYDWRYTGFGNTYIGTTFKKSKKSVENQRKSVNLTIEGTSEK